MTQGQAAIREATRVMVDRTDIFVTIRPLVSGLLCLLHARMNAFGLCVPPVTRVVAISIVTSACAIKGGDAVAIKRLSSNTYEVTTHRIDPFRSLAELQKADDQLASNYCSYSKGAAVVVARQGYGGLAPQDTLTFKCVKPADGG